MGGDKMYMPFGEIETPEFIKEFQEREKTALTDLKKNYKTTFLSFILRFKKVYSMTPIELKSNETQRSKDLRPIALTLLFRHCEDKEQIYKEMNPTKEEYTMKHATTQTQRIQTLLSWADEQGFSEDIFPQSIENRRVRAEYSPF